MTKETGRNIEIDLPEVVLHEFQHMLLARGKTAEKRNTSTLKPLNPMTVIYAKETNAARAGEGGSNHMRIL